MSTHFPDQIWLAGLQGAITITGAAVVYAMFDPWAAWSAVFGGCVAVIGTLWLAWRYVVGERRGYSGVALLRYGYRTALERFVLAAALLLAGFAGLRLAPAWVLAGFVVVQLVWLVAPVWMGTKNKHGKRS
jgi:hypothetical protein